MISMQIEENETEKRTKTQKKKTIASITDVIMKGGGKGGLLKLSEEIQSSGETIISSGTEKFVNGINAVTCEPKNRKRHISEMKWRERISCGALPINFAKMMLRKN
jgi:hypothetical protein